MHLSSVENSRQRSLNMSSCYELGTKFILQLLFTTYFIFKIATIATIVIGGLSRLDKLSYSTSNVVSTKTVSITTVTPARHVRILCLIVTYEARHDDAAVHVRRLWARHCNRVFFVSDVEHSELEPIVFQREHPSRWALIRASFDYVYRRYFNEFDWLLKVHDDNFVVIENLRYLLYPYSPDEAIYFGCKLKDKHGQPYMNAAAGYVLSKEALRRFVEIALPNDTLCLADYGYEDEELGKCLANVGVIAGDSRDKDGSSRFLPSSVREHLNGLDVEKHRWFYEQSYYAIDNGTSLMSRNAVCFANTEAASMYNFDYFIYRLGIYGMKNLAPILANVEAGY